MVLGTVGAGEVVQVHQFVIKDVVEFHQGLAGAVIVGEVDDGILRLGMIDVRLHDLRAGVPEAVDGLLDVADAEDVVLSCDQRDDRILDIVGILEFIDHDDREAPAVRIGDRTVVRLQDRQGEVLHVVKVDDLGILFELLIDALIAAGAFDQRRDERKCAVHVGAQGVPVVQDGRDGILAVNEQLFAVSKARVFLVGCARQRKGAAGEEGVTVAFQIPGVQVCFGLLIQVLFLPDLFQRCRFVRVVIDEQRHQFLQRLQDLGVLQGEEGKEGVQQFVWQLFDRGTLIWIQTVAQPLVRVGTAGGQRGEIGDGPAQFTALLHPRGEDLGQCAERFALVFGERGIHRHRAKAFRHGVVGDGLHLTGTAADDIRIRLQDGETEGVDGGDLCVLQQGDLTIQKGAGLCVAAGIPFVLQGCGQPLFHLVGSGFGEGHRQDRIDADPVLEHEIHEPSDQDRRLAAAGRSRDEHIVIADLNGAALLFIPVRHRHPPFAWVLSAGRGSAPPVHR